MNISWGYLIQVVAAILAIVGSLHSFNLLVSSVIIESNLFPLATLVYICIVLLEITIINTIVVIIRKILLVDSIEAKKLGLWVEKDETIIDMQTMTESINTMNTYYCIRKRIVNNIRFWSGSGPSESERQAPKIVINGLPQGISYKTDFVPSGNKRYYNIHFSPPIRAKYRIIKIQVSIIELTKGQYYSSQEDIPKGSKDEFSVEGYDYVNERIGLYTKKLSLKVIFPAQFVPLGKGYIGVRLGFSENPIPEEEKRLKDNTELSPGHNDRRELSVNIKNPILGATYFLLWKPPFKDSV